MTRLTRSMLAAALAAGAFGSCTSRSAAQLAVFDGANYQQSLTTSARALEQINNQVRQLELAGQQLARMDQNLAPLSATISPQLQRSLEQMQRELRAGDGLSLTVAATRTGYEQAFPRQVSPALSDAEALRNAKSRWEEEYAGLKRAALLQAEVAESVGGDGPLLGDALTRSRAAAGALAAQQAGNELAALGVKQALALQTLFAAQHRAETLTRARALAAEDEARERFRAFLGAGTAYAASR